MGDSGSADSANILAAITGDSNTMDFDLGSVVSAENLDMDFTLLGDSNDFNVDIEVDVNITIDVNVVLDIDVDTDVIVDECNDESNNNDNCDCDDDLIHSATLG